MNISSDWYLLVWYIKFIFKCYGIPTEYLFAYWFVLTHYFQQWTHLFSLICRTVSRGSALEIHFLGKWTRLTIIAYQSVKVRFHLKFFLFVILSLLSLWILIRRWRENMVLRNASRNPLSYLYFTFASVQLLFIAPCKLAHRIPYRS